MVDKRDDGGEILLGCWDCGSCGAQRLRGDAYQCASCGAPRPADVKFYLPSQAEVVRDPVGIRAAEAGPDWQCAFCQSWMPATDAVCRNCQAPVADSERLQRTKVYDQRQVPRSAGAAEQPSGAIPPRRIPPQVATSTYDQPQRAFSAPQPRAKRRVLSKPMLVGVLVLGVAVVFYGVNLAGRRRAYQEKVAEHQAIVTAVQQRYDETAARHHEATQRVQQAEQAVARAQNDVASAKATLETLRDERQAVEQATAVNVTSHTWKVELQIEQCDARNGEGWQHPTDAFDVTSEQRVHHHERVLDHVETLFRSETYREQDGFDTETYTERVSAGTRQVQDGYDVEDLGNGRFRQTPRYRSETVYENVTRTRRTPRMVTKTRQVPYQNNVYRQDPIHKPWYKYRTKIWNSAPVMTRTGEGLDVLDPEGRPPEDPGSEVGARRIRRRQVTYAWTVKPIAEDSPSRAITAPESRWRLFADGSPALLARNELLTADEQRARLASLSDRSDQAQAQIAALEAKVPPLAARVGPLLKQLPPLKQTLAKSQAELAAAKQAFESVVAAGY